MQGQVWWKAPTLNRRKKRPIGNCKLCLKLSREELLFPNRESKPRRNSPSQCCVWCLFRQDSLLFRITNDLFLSGIPLHSPGYWYREVLFYRINSRSGRTKRKLYSPRSKQANKCSGWTDLHFGVCSHSLVSGCHGSISFRKPSSFIFRGPST